jgi:hypothetical protein
MGRGHSRDRALQDGCVMMTSAQRQEKQERQERMTDGGVAVLLRRWHPNRCSPLKRASFEVVLGQGPAAMLRHTG